LKVQYADAESFVHDYTENLSRGGTFVASNRSWQLGDVVRMALSFPGLLDPVPLEGKVAWVRTGSSPGVGIEFDFAQTPEGRTRLEEVVDTIERADTREVARRIHVLLVEDNPMISELIQTGLKRAADKRPGLQTIFVFHNAGDGHQALEIIESTHLDMVITDINLPIMDGDKIIERIRKSPRASLPIIAVSAGGKETRTRALRAGADMYLAKPLRLIEVFETVSALLGLDVSDD